MSLLVAYLLLSRILLCMADGSAANPDDGSLTNPDDGSLTNPDDGSQTNPDDGSPTNPDDGSLTNPDDGSQTNPDDGSSTNPDDGSQTNPDDGSQTNPDDGSSTNPDDGSQTNPDDGSSSNPDDSGNPPAPTRVYNDPHFADNRAVIVHLHEWTYKDIAHECEIFLGPNNYGGVQTSPASENLIVKGRPWYERYQPISYQIETRSGNANDFYDMTQRCNRVGVRIYVDVIPNHMTANADNARGTGGSYADPKNFDYPGVPYTATDFHQPTCQITDFNDHVQARVCELVGLHDLDQSRPRVRSAIGNFLDRLTALGAAGFRVDATKHMLPEDLEAIYANLENLPTKYGFADESLPFIFQEVGDNWKFDYTTTGAVTEFAHPTNMAKFFKNQSDATALRNYAGAGFEMLDSANALVFVDNHDLQRQNELTLNYKRPREFRAAYAFTLAYPYGIVRVMSSFDFKSDQDGPPHDLKFNIKKPIFNLKKQCINGWVCEHRWPAIVAMVRFRNLVGDADLNNWYDDGDGVVSFCRGQRAFFAVSAGRYDFKQTLQTCLPAGIYCNALSTRKLNGDCRDDAKVLVKYSGKAEISLPMKGTELAFALLKEDLVGEDPFSR